MRHLLRATTPAALTAAALVFSVAAARAELRGEEVGMVRQLPATPAPHWFWISDILLHRTALFDGDSGQLLGTISSGTAGIGFVIFPLFGHRRGEIYLAETYWSRGVRGDRTDVVTVYDARTLLPKAEIPIPPKRGEYFPGNASNALSDDERFMAVLNITPATSVSIVDLEQRKHTVEIDTPGCSLLFSAGPRRFFLLCADGGAMVIHLDEQGGEAGIERTERVFDAQKDPLTEKAVRRGNEWIFVSYDGVIHTVNVGGGKLQFGNPWPLLGDADREESWRIGGLQHLAVHGASGRLFALMHQGPRDTHKDPGTEVWVYDMATQRRTARLELPSPLVTFVAEQSKLGHESTIDRFTRWLLGAALPNPGIERILVTQDEDPVLIVSSGYPPTISVLDADTGELRREISEPGIGFSLLFAP
ncbi:MAG TPA: amine dehydrogenase large subunit [Candidatus Limnocylindrales bacterium]|nr:amine dehydrogenase large subunit [Candidatus Limnocylindrales bacterium]